MAKEKSETQPVQTPATSRPAKAPTESFARRVPSDKSADKPKEKT